MSRGSSSTTLPHPASSTTSPTPRVRVPRHVVQLVARLVVDYFAYIARLIARLVVDYFTYVVRSGASARRTACRRPSPTPCVRVPRLLARLVIDHAPSRRSTSHRSVALALAVRPIASSRGSTTPCAAAADLSCGHTGSTSAMSCIATTCLTATPALLRVRHVPPRHRPPVALRRPHILTSFPN
jgi:hypothetical protein